MESAPSVPAPRTLLVMTSKRYLQHAKQIFGSHPNQNYLLKHVINGHEGPPMLVFLLNFPHALLKTMSDSSPSMCADEENIFTVQYVLDALVY
jgi:hypothetical protein